MNLKTCYKIVQQGKHSIFVQIGIPLGISQHKKSYKVTHVGRGQNGCSYLNNLGQYWGSVQSLKTIHNYACHFFTLMMSTLVWRSHAVRRQLELMEHQSWYLIFEAEVCPTLDQELYDLKVVLLCSMKHSTSTWSLDGHTSVHGTVMLYLYAWSLLLGVRIHSVCLKCISWSLNRQATCVHYC